MAEDLERLARLNEQLKAELAEAVDNGMVDPAPADVDQAEEELQEELTEEEKYAALNSWVTLHPLNREVLYKTLCFCMEEKALRDVEDYIATIPEFERATMNQYYLITSLVDAYGLDLIERTEEGVVVTPEMKEGKTEDEVDDLVFSLGYVTTDLGKRLVETHSPRMRLESLLAHEPERVAAYRDVLRFIGEQPRTYMQVQGLLAGSPVLQTVINGRVETMQPSVFLDKLERAGVLVWNGSWQITEEGRKYIAETED